MSYSLVYGRNPRDNCITVGSLITSDVQYQRYPELSAKINEKFFDGGMFAPKSFLSLFSLEIPEIDKKQHEDEKGQSYFNIGKRISVGAVIGIIESIPVIGSAIAVLTTLGHLIGMLHAYASLDKIVIEKNRDNSVVNYQDVLEHAIAFTVQQNQLVASLLSLIPLIKPIVRLAQGILYLKQSADPPALELPSS